MRVLCLYTSPPFPPDSGMRQRNWHLLRELARRADTHIVTWADEETGANGRDLPAEIAETTTIVPVRSPELSGPARLRRRLQHWAGGLPPFVQAAREVRAEPINATPGLAEAGAQRGPFDVVVLGDETAAFLPRPRNGAPVVVHRHNVFGRVVLESLPPGALWRVVGAVERRRWADFDARVQRDADLVVAPTAESAAELRARTPDQTVRILPSGVVPPAGPLRPSRGRDVVFVGWMNYRPNIDAVTEFARTGWPRIRDRFPDTRFLVVGREPTSEVLALADDRVVVTGEVPEVTAACASARLGVVPLRSGMGMKTKTLELMAMGLPVVTTPVGAEGVGARGNDGLVVGVHPAGFTDAVIALLEDADRADRLGSAARAYVSEHHRWSRIGDRYVSLLEEVVARRQEVVS